MPWQAMEMNTNTVCEVHIIPLCDLKAHTAPVCWCNPHRGTNGGRPGRMGAKETTERIWTHHAMDPDI